VTKEADLLYDICDILENAGDSLEKKPRKTLILRLTQERVHELSAGTNHKDLVLLDYFLKSFVSRLWDNFMIDFPYEVGERKSKIRRGILDHLIRDVGVSLVKLAKSLRKADLIDCYKAYQELASSYVQTTREMETERR
jgi:hypothetical protein